MQNTVLFFSRRMLDKIWTSKTNAAVCFEKLVKKVSWCLHIRTGTENILQKSFTFQQFFFFLFFLIKVPPDYLIYNCVFFFFSTLIKHSTQMTVHYLERTHTATHRIVARRYLAPKWLSKTNLWEKNAHKKTHEKQK